MRPTGWLVEDLPAKGDDEDLSRAWVMQVRRDSYRLEESTATFRCVHGRIRRTYEERRRTNLSSQGFGRGPIRKRQLWKELIGRRRLHQMVDNEGLEAATFNVHPVRRRKAGMRCKGRQWDRAREPQQQICRAIAGIDVLYQRCEHFERYGHVRLQFLLCLRGAGRDAQPCSARQREESTDNCRRRQRRSW